MKINSKIISEKVDYYIDLMLECEEADQNEVDTGDEPEEGEKQKNEIIDDIMEMLEADEMDEEFEILHDEEDDIDSEKDLNAADGKSEDSEEDVDEGFGSSLWAAISPSAKAAARKAKMARGLTAAKKAGRTMAAMNR